MSAQVRLGLIGDGIAASSAPRLHELAGRLAGLDVAYELIDLAALGIGFDAALDGARARGLAGVNVTRPCKEQALARCDEAAPGARHVGAVNTIVFEGGRARGLNTDHSGFLAVLDAAFGAEPLGPCCQIGAGGVGRATAFALAARGVPRLALADIDEARAEALAVELRAAAPGSEVTVHGDAAEAARGVEGLLNCTPVGMNGRGGSALPGPPPRGASWAFDAVYTPENTQFLEDARAAGLHVISGWELFFHQGVHAFEAFHGLPCPDPARLRTLLRGEEIER